MTARDFLRAPFRTRWVDVVFRNAWHHCGAVMCRLSVVSATLIWSAIVLLQRDALVPTTYAFVSSWAPENVYGWFYGLVSLILLYRIKCMSRPRFLGSVAYFVLFVSWLFVLCCLLIPWVMDGKAQPTATAWVGVGVVLALFAFVAGKKSTCGHLPHAPGDR